jgi:hypothetical protein
MNLLIRFIEFLHSHKAINDAQADTPIGKSSVSGKFLDFVLSTERRELHIGDRTPIHLLHSCPRSTAK